MVDHATPRRSWRERLTYRKSESSLSSSVKDVGAASAEGSEVSSRYASLWNPSNERDALLQIYNTDRLESLDEGGRWDAERLEKYYSRDSTVLDLGCGIGRIAQYVAPRCDHFWAVDVSQSMLDMARERLGAAKRVSYALCEDVAFASVPSDSVDLAYAVLVLQHLEREDAFLLLEELRRVIKRSGVVVVTYPNLASETYLKCFVDYAHKGEVTRRDRARLYTAQEVATILPAAGLEPSIEVGTELWVTARPICSA
ncbi:MAG: class I SAM-dependent methyltransferase [Actinomycetota bacterium]|nr:class I SAM-dependent methyltransferase [Actinomycetota bacterium]